MIENNIDISLLQDAHCNRERTLLIFPKNCKIFKSKNNSAHIVIRNTNLFLTHLFTDVRLVFISVTAKEGGIIIVSTYAAPSADFEDTVGTGTYHHTEGISSVSEISKLTLLFGAVGAGISGKTSSQNTSSFTT